MKNIKQWLYLGLSLGMYLGIVGEAKAEICHFQENVTVVCVTFGNDTQCETNSFWDLTCVPGGSSGGGYGSSNNGDRGLAQELRSGLERGMSLALTRLTEVSSCENMHTALGLNVSSMQDVLALTAYISGAGSRECDLHPSGAWTDYGSFFVRICPDFGDLRQVDQAMLLLHEALHTAGQLEHPRPPGAPTSRDISGFVRENCNLQ